MSTIFKNVLVEIKSRFRRFNNKKTIYFYPPTSNGWEKITSPLIGSKKDDNYFDPCVIKDGDLFIMFLSYRNDKTIVRSTSYDGLHWDKPIEVLKGTQNSWDENVNRSFVLKKDDIWYMWYTGVKANSAKIGLAFSKDGVVFEKYHNNPVLFPSFSFEKDAVMNPFVLWDTEYGVFKCWYSAGDKYEPDYICYAESKDGILWNKPILTPIFSKGTDRYDSFKIGGCDVKRIDNKYVMFYIGYENIDNARICEAYSEDGISNWIRNPANPIISPTKNAWDRHATYKPSFFLDLENKKQFIWYNGRFGTHECIGVAKKEI